MTYQCPQVIIYITVSTKLLHNKSILLTIYDIMIPSFTMLELNNNIRNIKCCSKWNSCIYIFITIFEVAQFVTVNKLSE